MEEQEWQAVVFVMQQAPLNNMAHAQQVDHLILKVQQHAGLVQQPVPVGEDVPEQGDLFDD